LTPQISGYAGALLVAGVSFYVAKWRIEVKRKADLEVYRACELAFSPTHLLLFLKLHFCTITTAELTQYTLFLQIARIEQVEKNGQQMVNCSTSCGTGVKDSAS
jgi:hypothetical protein